MSMAFVSGIHWPPVDSPHKDPVTQKMFPFGDIIMRCQKALSDSCTVMHDETDFDWFTASVQLFGNGSNGCLATKFYDQ